MRVPFLDLRAQTTALRRELDAAIAATLDESRFVGGDAIERFEHAWAERCGARHAVGVGNGTDALALALRAAGVGAGDEVLAPANTCVPTIAGIEAARATPVLVDADPGTRLLDASRLADAATERTRAVVPVHLYGRVADASTADAARELGLVVVEDAAQAHGAEGVGALGVAAAFSFYPTKNLGALGDGGAIVTDDDAVAEEARALRSYGERERYRSEESGVNSRLDTLQAAVLLAKLDHLDAWIERRRALAALYDELLDGLPLERPELASGHAWHLYVVRVPERDRFRAALSDSGIGTAVHYPRAVHEHPAYEHLRRDGFPVAEALAREVVSLPLHPELTDDDVRAVASAVEGALSGRR